MKNKILVILTAALALWAFGAEDVKGGSYGPGTYTKLAGADRTGTREINDFQFALLVDEVIFQFEDSVEMTTFGTVYEREDFELSLRKARFFRQNRDRLIADLVNSGVEPEMRAVAYYLDQCYFAGVHDSEPDVAEAYSAPEDALPASKEWCCP